MFYHFRFTQRVNIKTVLDLPIHCSFWHFRGAEIWKYFERVAIQKSFENPWLNELERRFQINKYIFNSFCISWRIWMSTINWSDNLFFVFFFLLLFLQTFVLFLSQQSVLKDFCLLPQVLKYLRLLFLFVEKMFFIHKITTYCSSVFF